MQAIISSHPALTADLISAAGMYDENSSTSLFDIFSSLSNDMKGFLEELEEMTSAQVSQLKAITGMTDVNERAAYGHFKDCLLYTSRCV